MANIFQAMKFPGTLCRSTESGTIIVQYTGPQRLCRKNVSQSQCSKEKNRLLPTTVAAVIKTKLTNMKCGQFYDYLLTQPLKEIGGVETVIVLYFNNSFSTHNFIQILNNIILIPFNQFSLLLTYILLLLLYYRILFLI